MAIPAAPLHRPLRLAQISDTHFCAEPGAILDSGVDSDAALRRVLDHIQRHQPGLERIVATGDLAQDPVPASYARLRRELGRYRTRCHCLPGNHDDTQLMLEHLPGGNVDCPRVVVSHDWLLLFADSSVPGEAQHGRLAREELEFIDDVLTCHPAPHALLCLHHHPVALGSPWLDAIGLDNGDALFDLLARHRQVRGVLFGHVHQPVDALHRGVRLLGTPSTCVQFVPDRGRLELDTAPPAYRRVDLYADGRIESEVVTVEAACLRASA